jgi:hypothetical protein
MRLQLMENFFDLCRFLEILGLDGVNGDLEGIENCRHREMARVKNYR